VEVFRTGNIGVVGETEAWAETCIPVSGKGGFVASMLGHECAGIGSDIVAYGGGIDIP
jgi:hypothetical protein